MSISEAEMEWLQKWAADCIKHNDIDDVPERVLDVLAEVRRLRKFRGDNLVVAEMKIECQRRELERLRTKTQQIREESDVVTPEIECGACERMVPADATICPYCRARYPQEPVSATDSEKRPQAGVMGSPRRCAGCGVNLADYPSIYCPGCQAYREHQA